MNVTILQAVYVRTMYRDCDTVAGQRTENFLAIRLEVYGIQQ